MLLIRSSAATMLAALALGGSVTLSPAFGHGPDNYYGWHGMMGPGYGMGQGMMGPGMMGPGYGMMGPGMMGPGYGMMGPGYGRWAGANANLTVEDVRGNFERWLSWQGNPRLKLGNVKEEGKDSITADITTKDGAVVDRFRVDRATGAMRRIE